MKRYLAGIVLMICVSAGLSYVHAQNITISGQVCKQHFGGGLYFIENADVYLEVPGITGGTLYLVIDSAKTNKRGEYSFDSIYVGSYRITFIAKGYQILQIFPKVSKDTTIFTDLVPLTKYFSLTGKVTVDCQDCKSIAPVPIPGCTVKVTFPFTLSYMTQSARDVPIIPIVQLFYKGITDSDGVYRIDSIPDYDQEADSASVSAVKRGYQTQLKRKVLSSNSTDTLDFALVQLQTSTLSPITAKQQKQALSYSRSTGTLQLSIGSNQNVEIYAFLPNGKLIGTLMKHKNLKPGVYDITLEGKLMAKGAAVIYGTGDSFREVLTIIR